MVIVAAAAGDSTVLLHGLDIDLVGLVPRLALTAFADRKGLDRRGARKMNRILR